MNEDKREEALRLAKEAGMQPGQWEYESQKLALIALIALARESAAPQKPYCPNCHCTSCAEIGLAKFDADVKAPQEPEPEPDPSDELAWYKWAHKELGRRNVKLAEENFQYWQKERDATPQPQAAPQELPREWVMVPRKPTHGMTGAILNAGENRWPLMEIWEKMIAAAPPAPQDAKPDALVSAIHGWLGWIANRARPWTKEDEDSLADLLQRAEEALAALPAQTADARDAAQSQVETLKAENAKLREEVTIRAQANRDDARHKDNYAHDLDKYAAKAAAAQSQAAAMAGLLEEARDFIQGTGLMDVDLENRIDLALAAWKAKQ
jgi:hypothetical protein